MLELAVLLVSTLPFILGLYALRVLDQRRDDDADDPPPPDTGPPVPVRPAPSSPHRRHPTDDRNPTSDRRPHRRRPHRPRPMRHAASR